MSPILFPPRTIDGSPGVGSVVALDLGDLEHAPPTTFIRRDRGWYEPTYIREMDLCSNEGEWIPGPESGPFSWTHVHDRMHKARSWRWETYVPGGREQCPLPEATAKWPMLTAHPQWRSHRGYLFPATTVEHLAGAPVQVFTASQLDLHVDYGNVNVGTPGHLEAIGYVTRESVHWPIHVMDPSPIVVPEPEAAGCGCGDAPADEPETSAGLDALRAGGVTAEEAANGARGFIAAMHRNAARVARDVEAEAAAYAPRARPYGVSDGWWREFGHHLTRAERG